jgi:hypothetical protein
VASQPKILVYFKQEGDILSGTVAVLTVPDHWQGSEQQALLAVDVEQSGTKGFDGVRR